MMLAMTFMIIITMMIMMMLFSSIAIGLSHPLGMMNGGILKEQLIVPSGNSTTDNARLYTSSAWKAEDAYITLHTGTHTCFTGLTSVPMSVLLNAPIFFEVTFFRPKWLYYLVIQDGNAVSGEDKTSRKFALAYRNLEGKSVSYSTDGLSAQVCLHYRVSQKKVPTFENSSHHDYITDLNHSNYC